ncbi:MAG: hypothetical protein AAGA12_15380 [Pseudomonadota bacterium]
MAVASVVHAEHPDATDLCPGSIDDRDWFCRYPKRDYRVRWADEVETDNARCAIGGEPPPPFMRAAVVVSRCALEMINGKKATVRLTLYWKDELPVGEQESKHVFEFVQNSLMTGAIGFYAYHGPRQ